MGEKPPVSVPSRPSPHLGQSPNPETRPAAIGAETMGTPQRDARVALERKLPQYRTDFEEIDRRIKNERRLADEMAKEVASRALAASDGNAKALQEQVAFRGKQQLHLQQAENLELLAAPLRDKIDLAEVELLNLAQLELLESISDKLEVVPPMCDVIASRIQPFAQAAGDLRRYLDAIVEQVLPSLGEDKRTNRLLNLGRAAVKRGILAELSEALRAQGLSDVINVRDLQGGNFVSFVDTFLELLRGAMATHLPVGEGRARYRATTNINGLHGLRVTAGEELTLYVADTNVRKMVELGALEKISDVPTAEVAG